MRRPQTPQPQHDPVLLRDVAQAAVEQGFADPSLLDAPIPQSAFIGNEIDLDAAVPRPVEPIESRMSNTLGGEAVGHNAAFLAEKERQDKLASAMLGVNPNSAAAEGALKQRMLNEPRFTVVLRSFDQDELEIGYIAGHMNGVKWTAPLNQPIPMPYSLVELFVSQGRCPAPVDCPDLLPVQLRAQAEGSGQMSRSLRKALLGVGLGPTERPGPNIDNGRGMGVAILNDFDPSVIHQVRSAQSVNIGGLVIG